MCSALAVTVQLENSLVMGISLTFTVAGSNFILSLIRHYIPHNIRIIVELAVISSLVNVIDELVDELVIDAQAKLLESECQHVWEHDLGGKK